MKILQKIWFVSLPLAMAVACSTQRPASRNDASSAPPKPDRSLIERMLAADRRWQLGISEELKTSQHPDPILSNHRAPKSIVSNYIDVHRAAIQTDWPREFQLAYLDNIQAWETLRFNLEQEAPKDGGVEVLLGAVGMYFGVPPHLALAGVTDGIAKNAAAERQRVASRNTAASRIMETWQGLERTALGCGADINAQPTCGYFGIRALPITPSYAKTHRLTDPSGAILVGLIDEGPAVAAGLRQGDIIKAISDYPIVDHHHLIWTIGMTSPGVTIRVTVVRSGEVITKDVTLASQPQTPP